MAARNSKRGFKRFLEDSAADRVDQGKSGCSYVRSKRFKTMFTRENVEGSDESGRKVFCSPRKISDWGENNIAIAAETTAPWALFQQEEEEVWHKLDHPNISKFVGASMGSSNLKIIAKGTRSDGQS